MKLLELISLQHKIENAVIENNGELPAELDSAFELTGDAIAEKIDAYAWTIERCEVLASEFKSKAEEFYNAGKQFDNMVRGLKERLKFASNVLGPDLIGNDYRFKVSNSKPKLIIDVATENIEPKFTIAETIIKPNTDAIRLAIEGGMEIDGCKLESSQSIRKYVNKKEITK